MGVRQHVLLTEAEHQAQVIELAHMLGWHHLHVRRSIGKGRTWVTATNVIGWPDLVLFRHADDGQQHLIFAELKSESGKLTPEQEQVLLRAGQTFERGR